MAKRKKLKSSLSLFLKFKILLILGFILISIPTIFYINAGIQLANFTPKVVAQAVKSTKSKPVIITIPAVHLYVDIKEESIKNGVWDVSENSASHLDTSASPDENGTIIVYGHNTTNLFGPIRWLNVGEKINLISEDKKIHTYEVKEIKEVDPTQTDILTSQKGETLILYTCSSFADLKRYIVIAK